MTTKNPAEDFTKAELDELTSWVAAPSEALLELAPIDRMTANIDSAIARQSTDRSSISMRRWSLLYVAAGVLVVFAGGLLTGRLFFPVTLEYSGPPRWITAAVDHTNLYTSETMTSNTLSEAQKIALVASASRHIGKDLDSAAHETARADFQNGELMEFEGKPLVQLNFLHDEKTPFALYILRTPDSDQEVSLAEAPFKKGKVDELTAMRWSRPGYEYFTVGRLARDHMDRVAEALAVQLE